MTSWRTVRNDDLRVDGMTALSVTRQGDQTAPNSTISAPKEVTVRQASIRECTSREPQRQSFEAPIRALTYTGVVPVRPAIASAPHATRTAIAIRSKTQICQVFTAETSARNATAPQLRVGGG